MQLAACDQFWWHFSCYTTVTDSIAKHIEGVTSRQDNTTHTDWITKIGCGPAALFSPVTPSLLKKTRLTR